MSFVLTPPSYDAIFICASIYQGRCNARFSRWVDVSMTVLTSIFPFMHLPHLLLFFPLNSFLCEGELSSKQVTLAIYLSRVSLSIRIAGRWTLGVMLLACWKGISRKRYHFYTFLLWYYIFRVRFFRLYHNTLSTWARPLSSSTSAIMPPYPFYYYISFYTCYCSLWYLGGMFWGLFCWLFLVSLLWLIFLSQSRPRLTVLQYGLCEIY